MPEKELRSAKSISIREAVGIASEPPVKQIHGTPILYNVETVINDWFGKYREVIRSGAATNSLAGKNIRMLNQHDSKQPLGTTKHGTLRLTETIDGINCECDLANTAEGATVYEQIKRGDVDGMSFGFYVTKERWTFSEEEGVLDLREILEIELLEVSPVTFPAYEQTSIAVRGFSDEEKKDLQVLGSLVNRSKHGGLTNDQRSVAKDLLKRFDKLLREEEEQEVPVDLVAEAKEKEANEKIENELLSLELESLTLDVLV